MPDDSKADKTLLAVPLFFAGEDIKVDSIRKDLLGDVGRIYLDKVNRGLSQRYREIIERHYGFNPENS